MASAVSRNEFLDVCKGIGILCVYYGHTALWGTVPSRMIFSFHMPLFFLVSGIFMSEGSVRKVWARAWKNLVLPYLFFVVVGQIIKIDQTLAAWSADPLGCLSKIVHGEGSNAIWFLICLADLQILTNIVFRNVAAISTGVKVLIIAVLAVLADVVFRVLPFRIAMRLPFMLASVPSAMVFFLTGVLFKDRFLSATKTNMSFRTVMLLMLPMFMVFAGLGWAVQETFDIRRSVFSLIVLPLCLAGFVTVYIVASFAMHFSVARNFLSALGRRSLPLFALELPLAYVVAKISNGYFPQQCTTTPHPVYIEPFRIISILTLAWLCSYPIMWMLDKIRRIVYVQP